MTAVVGGWANGEAAAGRVVGRAAGGVACGLVCGTVCAEFRVPVAALFLLCNRFKFKVCSPPRQGDVSSVRFSCLSFCQACQGDGVPDTKISCQRPPSPQTLFFGQRDVSSVRFDRSTFTKTAAVQTPFHFSYLLMILLGRIIFLLKHD
jgi:hypothetical protein